jgi:hypothetical protein
MLSLSKCATGFIALSLLIFDVSAATRVVNNVFELDAAVSAALAGDEIVLQPGVYQLTRTINLSRPRLTVRGATGNREDVLLRGGGMNTRGVDEGVSVAANDITIRDLSLEEFYFNGIHTRAENDVDRCTISNVKTINIGERHIKGSRDPNSATKMSDDFTIERVWMLQTKPRNGHPDTSVDYIGGIDMMAMKNLVIRDCRAEGIVSSANGGNAAIFLWQGIQNVTLERNQILGCAKGIALGNPAAPAANLPTGAWHCDGAIIRNNMVLRGPWTTGNNIGLELASAKNVTVAHNTFYSAQADYFRLISFSETPPGLVTNIFLQNNIIRGRIYSTTQGKNWTSISNIIDGAGTVIVPGWFTAATNANFHLTPQARPALDAGETTPTVSDDFDQETRPDGLRPDVGADEFKSADIDHDNIPDRAEVSSTPFIVGVDDTIIDTDGDGASNAHEYFAGTDPSNSNSILKLLATATNASEISIAVATSIGWDYEIQFANDVTEPMWETLTNFPGTGSLAPIVHPVAGGQRFYRVKALP